MPLPPGKPTAATRGIEGERRVAKILGKSSPEQSYYVINDYFFVSGRVSCQIDHIVVSKYGVFVIETKNLSGRIYGKDTDQTWTQVLNYGKNKYKIYNPVKQNMGHINCLKTILPYNTKIFGMVVFISADIRFLKSNHVCFVRDLVSWLESFTTSVMDESWIQTVLNCLKDYECTDERVWAEHCSPN